MPPASGKRERRGTCEVAEKVLRIGNLYPLATHYKGMMRRITASLLFLPLGCFPVPWPDVPDPEPPAPSVNPEPCEGLPREWAGWYTADDPCCPVHQCLVDAGADACDMFDACYALGDGAVCGDTLCDGMQCSLCE